jgi:hypothetical protein
MTSLRRLIRRSPPRILSPKEVRDNRSCIEPASSPDLMTSNELVSEMGRLCSTGITRSNHSSTESLGINMEAYSNRLRMLLPMMDPTLVYRAVKNILQFASVEKREIDELVGIISPRFVEMNLGTLTRIAFVLLLSERLSPDSVTVLRASVIPIVSARVSSHNCVAPQILSKLFVIFSEIPPSEGHEVWQRLEYLAHAHTGSLQPEHVQQISYSLSRRKSHNMELSSALITRGVFLSPVKETKTYMSMLIALSRLPKKGDDESWSLFKHMARDHIGLKEGHFPLGLLRTLLKPHDFTDHNLRLIRNSFRT